VSTVDAPVALAKGAFSWRDYGADWEVHKFGGASLDDADLYKTCGDLLISQASRETSKWIPTAAIVSAAGGMTDALVSVISTAVNDKDTAAEKLKAAVKRQVDIVLELVPGRPDLTDPVVANLESDGESVGSLLTTMALMRGVPPQMLELVAGLGEVWSAQTLAAYLKSTGHEADWVDARDVLVVPEASSMGLGEKGQAMDTIQPLWDTTMEKMQNMWSSTFASLSTGANAPLLVITGFVCSTEDGRPTTLKRSGSDYSATIFAKVLGSASVTFWKNVNGVYTADPRRVPDAFSIPQLTFDEAMELAYFGGQVLHPSAMVPCIEKRIPVLVKNVFNPSHPGTKVYGRGDAWNKWADQDDDVTMKDFPVKAITSIEKVSLVTISGASFLGTMGVARRMMQALEMAGANVILASQGSSEHSITVAVDAGDQERALEGLKEAFAMELARDSEIRVAPKPDCSIVAIIGEGMKERTGISSRFFSSLGRAQVNVIAIAQGASERNISVVVPQKDLSRALRAAHEGFTLSNMKMAIGILGTGTVGSEVVKQLAKFEASQGRRRELPAMMQSKNLDIEVRMIADTKQMVLAEHGLPLQELAEEEGVAEISAWGKKVADLGDDFQVVPTEMGVLEDFLDTKRIPHKVIIDCTPSAEVAKSYPRWLRKGIHVISTSECAGSGPLDRWADTLEATRSGGRWLYETTVGAEVPVIATIHDLVQTGDDVKKVEGVLSGSVGFILNAMEKDPSKTMGEALSEAAARGLTEPDPRDDLSGLDAARKAVIIARELGLQLDLADVATESLLPEDGCPEDTTAGIAGLLDSTQNQRIRTLMQEAKDRGEVLKYVCRVDVQQGEASVALRSCPRGNALSTVNEADNVVLFVTDRYAENTPLVVRGPGAGAGVTASGVLAELLRLSKQLNN
jgi:aspartokinase/homoserine dehydrogenase 1